MPYTHHGHYVPNGPLKIKPQLIARCGGPGLCASCATDVGQHAPVHTEQPMPNPNDRPSIQSLVRADLDAREQVGIQRYGTPLQPRNGRDALRDAYEEALDLSCYLKQAIVERDGAAPDAQNRISGTVTGPVVQARDITGGVRL